MKISLASLLIVTALNAAPGADFAPCDGAISLSRVDLQLEARLVEQLGIDRPPSESGGWPIFRFIVKPDYFPGNANPGAESTVAIYLPDSGDAILEFFEARHSIRGANSLDRRVPGAAGTYEMAVKTRPVRVPVTVSRVRFDRDLAVAIQTKALEIIQRAKVPDGETLLIRIHPTDYTITAWRPGYGTQCASAAAHLEEFAQSWEGRLQDLLRLVAEKELQREEGEESIRQHLAR